MNLVMFLWTLVPPSCKGGVSKFTAQECRMSQLVNFIGLCMISLCERLNFQMFAVARITYTNFACAIRRALVKEPIQKKATVRIPSASPTYKLIEYFSRLCKKFAQLQVMNSKFRLISLVKVKPPPTTAIACLQLYVHNIPCVVELSYMMSVNLHMLRASQQ